MEDNMRTVGIIGGGIIGATAAFYLTKQPDLQVTLFDSGRGQATKAASGIISPWLSKRRNKRWYSLAQSGAEFYEQLVHDADLDKSVYEQTGTIVTRKDAQAVDELYDLAKSRAKTTSAIGEVRKVSAAEITDLMPIVSCDESGIYVSGGAKINGEGLVEKLLFHAKNNGLKLVNEQVSLVNEYTVRTKSDQFVFSNLVLSPGAFLKQLLEPLNYHVDIRPQKGQLVDMRISNQVTDEMPVMMPESENDIIPFKDGIVTIGATHENDKGFDLTPTNTEINNLLNSGTKFVTELKSAERLGVRIGTRGYTSDFAPFFGELTANMYVAGGLGSSGLTTGPIIGKLISDWISSQTPPADLDLLTKPVSNYIYSK